MKRLTIILLLCLTLSTAGCSTIQSYQAGERGWQELAVASCQDLELASVGASAAVAWSKIYFPNQQEAFANTIEPLLCQIVAGVDAYCAAVDVVQDVSGFTDLLQKKTELLTLVERLETLLMLVKGQA
jgi:uncharacterized protein YceK